MKKTLILIPALFAACASVHSQIDSKKDQFIQNKVLTIEKIILNDRVLKINNQGEKASIIFEHDRFYGHAGCNRFFGSYDQNSQNTLKIDQDRIASTQMLCYPLDVMDFENTFFSNFRGNFEISNENNTLIFDNGIIKIFLKQ